MSRPMNMRGGSTSPRACSMPLQQWAGACAGSIFPRWRWLSGRNRERRSLISRVLFGSKIVSMHFSWKSGDGVENARGGEVWGTMSLYIYMGIYVKTEG